MTNFEERLARLERAMPWAMATIAVICFLAGVVLGLILWGTK